VHVAFSGVWVNVGDGAEEEEDERVDGRDVGFGEVEDGRRGADLSAPWRSILANFGGDI
jgi:hypothetical protein